MRLRSFLISTAFVIIIINSVVYLYFSSNCELRNGLSRQIRSGRLDLLLEHHLGRFHGNSSGLGKFAYLMPRHLMQQAETGLPVTISADEFRKSSKIQTGNPLIDTYGQNDQFISGERGRGVTFAVKEKDAAEKLQKEFQINVMASDVIPLNRMVPDSRMDGCRNLTYEHDLPLTTIIIPFYNEWPSVLLRTVYSLLNRTPRHLLQEILLVDDCSTMADLKGPLDQYLKDYFPRDLVRVLRMPERKGLIRARMAGWRESKGEVLVFFDSHMEVNIDWLQPLLTEIKKDRHTVSMSLLDYINRQTLEYDFHNGYEVRYAFDWRFVFWETFFRDDQIGPTPQSPRPGAVMVGAAFAIDREYFMELGGYDTGMQVWGGENIEMSWRVWMCGGRMVHLPCSHLGHIARGQPYSFPKGRMETEMYNYKRAALVWLGDYIKFVYDYFKNMKDLDVGDVSERLAIKERLQCRNFTWYIDNVWPELFVYDRDVQAWGSLVNNVSRKCLDNHGYLFQAPADLFIDPCHYTLQAQGFSLTKSGLLRTTMHCVVVKDRKVGGRPQIEDCLIGSKDKWTHTPNATVVHLETKLCLDQDSNGPVMKRCVPNKPSQQWSFTHYVNS